MRAGRALQPPDLIEEVCAGSAAALAEMFRQYGAAVHRAAYGIVRSRSDADDVTQDVFVALPRALRSYRGAGSLEGWLKRSAVRTALMRLRAGGRRREEPVDDDMWERASARDNPAADREIDRISINSAIDALPESLRVVFVLKTIEGYAHDEIAELLDISQDASRARLARARTELRRILS